MARIKKNDLVQVMTGKDKGKRGTVLEVCPVSGKVKVKGLALQTHHVKARRQDEVSGLKKIESFIDVSNVMPVCPSSDKPCRVNVKVLDNGTKQRVSNRSQEALR
jgi:large subunit ribosomal protein L24